MVSHVQSRSRGPPKLSEGQVCCIWFSIISTALLAVVLGSVSLAYLQNRLSLYDSKCLVLNATLTSNTTDPDGYDPQTEYYLEWTVEYYNSIAKKDIVTTLKDQESETARAVALLDIYSANTTHTCYYTSYDFEVRWNLPDSNWEAIGIAALVFSSIFLALILVVLIFTLQERLSE